MAGESAATSFGELVAAGVLAVGDGYRAKNEELGTSGPVFLRSAYLQDSGWVLANPDRLAKPHVRDFGAKVARPLDTVLTTKGNSLGRLGLVRDGVVDAIYSPHLSFWRSLRHDLIDPRFLYYWARSPVAQQQVKARSASTDMAPYLSLADQLTLKIALPDIKIQAAVGHVLGSLDDKIELNRRMAGTLEEMARALFKSWFVDFDPVRSKADGHPTSLPTATVALFPNRFGEDGLPEGWKRESLRPSLAQLVTRGIAPAYADDGLTVVNQKCIRNGQVDFAVARHHDQNSRVVPDTKLLRVGDILINSTGAGTLGRVAQVRRLDVNATVDTHVTIVRPSRDGAWSICLGLQLVTREAEIERLGDGSTGQTELARDAVAALTVIVPPEGVVSKFADAAAPLLARADAALAEVRTLRSLRDTLLPKLISGEFRIKDAESAVEAA